MSSPYCWYWVVTTHPVKICLQESYVIIAGSVALGGLASVLVWLANRNAWWKARFGDSNSFFDMVTDRVHSRAVSWLLVAMALVLAAQVSRQARDRA
jgi:hypothetical protein